MGSLLQVIEYQLVREGKDGDKGRPEGGSYSSARHLADLLKPDELGRDAASRALAKVGQAKQPTGTYDIVVENRVANQLLEGMLQSMTAWAIQQKNSFLDGKLGQKIGSCQATSETDPLAPRKLTPLL